MDGSKRLGNAKLKKKNQLEWELGGSISIFISYELGRIERE